MKVLGLDEDGGYGGYEFKYANGALSPSTRKTVAFSVRAKGPFQNGDGFLLRKGRAQKLPTWRACKPGTKLKTPEPLLRRVYVNPVLYIHHSAFSRHLPAFGARVEFSSRLDNRRDCDRPPGAWAGIPVSSCDRVSILPCCATIPFVKVVGSFCWGL